MGRGQGAGWKPALQGETAVVGGERMKTVLERTIRDRSDHRWDEENPGQTARGAPKTAKYRPEPPCFPGIAYSGCIPTITAFGEPHSALAPVWLLRQTIFIGLAGAAAG
jgi:hypothetical protein